MAHFLSEMDCSPIEPDSSMLSASSSTKALISLRSSTRARVTICDTISTENVPYVSSTENHEREGSGLNRQ